MSTSESLSHSATARALRALIVTNGAWGAWAQMVSLQTAVFTGFVLWLGASEASIAHFVSIGSFSSLAQILSSALLVHRIRHKKAFVIGMGCLHSLFRFSVVLVPLVFASARWWRGLRRRICNCSVLTLEICSWCFCLARE